MDLAAQMNIPTSPITSETVSHIIEQLWAGGDRERCVYALLDSARDPAIYPMIQDSRQRSLCLYREPLSDKLRAAAPYIIELSRGGRFTRQLLEASWGQNWGLFLMAPTHVSMDVLGQHCRKLNMVKGPSGERLFFRYYDPRVMSVYLPTCTQAELDTVFGPATDIMMESEDFPHRLHHVHFQHHRLGTDSYSV